LTICIDAMGLKKSFDGNVAVDNVSLRIPEGEVLGFLGPNGAGKTTTMRMITGFLEPDAGEVSICDVMMSERPTLAKANIGYLPEGAPLYGEMTPLQLLHFCGNARGMAHDILEERVHDVVTQLGLESVLRQPIDTLSKGFKRRVGLSQALLHDPKVLVLDEPTDGLDPLQKQDVRALIRDMSATKAILISTHILDEVEAVCDRAIIIDQGHIIADGNPKDIKKLGRTRSFEKAFLKLIAKAGDADA